SRDRTRHLQDRVDEALKELRVREVDTLLRLARAAEQRDRVTGLHLVRMAKYSALIAREYGLGEEEQEAIELAAPMHDIGKIGIPDRILQFNGKLSREEMQVMQTHTTIGYDLLKDSPSKYLRTAAIIALSHHEKFDGKGYPNGLSATDIPLEARIVAVGDVYDALTSVRPYKAAWLPEEAFKYLEGERGRHFDAGMVDLFLTKKDEILAIGKQFADWPIPQ
ncbi:MAG: HD domain-containing protein, partial [Burkholderiales bacterium]|nr:HD domain-containing protein [Burkholderiales bacterium]